MRVASTSSEEATRTLYAHIPPGGNWEGAVAMAPGDGRRCGLREAPHRISQGTIGVQTNGSPVPKPSAKSAP